MGGAGEWDGQGGVVVEGAEVSVAPDGDAVEESSQVGWMVSFWGLLTYTY